MRSLSRTLAAALFACALHLTSAPHAAAQTAVQPGQVIISEVRFRGPAGDEDEFIELYNNTDSDIVVRSSDGSPGWAVVASDGVTRFVIPNNTFIPARNHLLAANTNGYSLSAYPSGDPVVFHGTPVGDGRVFNPGDPDAAVIGDDQPAPNFSTATPDIKYALDIPNFGGVALFTSAVAARQTLANRLDAFGFNTAPELYREGAGVAPRGITHRESSYFRDLSRNLPKDTGDNAADFVLAGTIPDLTGELLGAPGPENINSPILRNDGFTVAPLVPQVSTASPPNRERNTTPVRNGDLGTVTIRRTFTNNTGRAVTRLRFRVNDITTRGSAPTCGADGRSPCADVRVLSSEDGPVAVPGGVVLVRGVKLEEPPEQDSYHGGGYNSTLSADFVTVSTPIQNGQSVRLQFTLGVMRGGTFRFLVNIEAAPNSTGDEPSPPGV